MRIFGLVKDDEDDDEKAVKPWIEEHIKCRECKTFIDCGKSPNAEDPTCGCGYTQSRHASGITTDTRMKWNYKFHTRLLDTNSYGRLNFIDEDGNQQPSFVKVAVDYMDPEKCSTIIKLFENRWNLPKPNLLISVTGGAKDFNVSPELLSEFKKGLMKAAKSTNAWVITGGTNTGVMKLVGEAVRGSSFGSNITTIGIASWGIVKNRDQLIRPMKKKKNKKKLVFDYPTKDEPRVHEAYLDPNHSHFLLADNGTQNKYGVEIAMRGAIEAAITEYYSDNYNIPGGPMLKLPMICILVEGGPNSVASCLAAIQNGNPVLVLSGSGRAADIIAKAHRFSRPIITYSNNRESIQRQLPEEYKPTILSDINKQFSGLSDEGQQGILLSLVELLKYDKLLTIYGLKGDKNNDFDNAILIAMIRSVMHDTGAKMSQMMLAITWDRLQIAQDLILAANKFDNHELEQCLRAAIIQNRVGFVRKVLDCEADMKHYLTYQELTNLYNTMDAKSQTIGKSLLQRAQMCPNELISLHLIGVFLENIMGGSYRSQYTLTSFMYESVKGYTMDAPYDTMVIFATIMQFHEMAMLFWCRCKEPIATALMAAKVNWFLSEFESNKLACDEDNTELLKKQGFEFESLACAVLIQCYRKFERKDWTTVLTAPRKCYNNLNLLQIAKTVGADNFIAESPVQSYLNHTWMGQIHHSTSMRKILLCAIPPLFLLLRYNKHNLTVREQQQWERRSNKKNTKAKGIGVLIMLPAVQDNADVEGFTEQTDSVSLGVAPTRRKLYWDEAFGAYYRSPATKFILHFITYFFFLFAYGYTLIVGPKYIGFLSHGSNLTGYDILFFLWILGQIPSEVDQILGQNPPSLRDKLSCHFKDVFNVLDVLGIVTYLISFTLKLTVAHNEDVPVSGPFTLQNVYHLINILAFAFLALRFIQVMEVSITIGPKLIMIGKMMIDLAFFIFLLVIFLVTYGICAQALQSPNEALSGNRLYNVVLRPALNVFGEIGLEDMQSDILEGHCEFKDGQEECSADFDELIEKNQIGAIHYYTLQCFMFSYLLFVNILLVNLLIAIFSNTYETIEAEASKLWKVQWCSVVLEFSHRQPLPNPLSLLYYIVFFFSWSFRKCQNTPKCMPEVVLPEVDYYDLTMRVAEAREDYILQKEEEDESGDIRRTLKFIKDKLLISQMNERPDLSRFISTADDPEKQVMFIKHPEVHIDSRKTPYIGTDIKRFPVTDDVVPWEENIRGYNPVSFTEENIINNKNKLEVDPTDPTQIAGQFNSAAEYAGHTIDRMSFSGIYVLSQGYPLNPKGRTGLRGRGQLARWGPNHTADPIVTRWARDSENNILHIDNLPILEFVAIFLKESRKWAIPGGPIKPGEKLIAALKREFGEDALGTLENSDKGLIKQMLTEHLSLGIAVYKGYVDDPRNTDNAWVEAHAINYHDGLGTSFSHFPLKPSPSGEALHVQWLPLDSNMDLYGNHESVLEKVCFHRHAYNPFSLTARKELPVVD